MRSTGVMAMTTTATDCEWSFLGAAGAPGVALVGSVVRLEADMDLHPGAQSTGSLCQVNITLAKIHFAGLILDTKMRHIFHFNSSFGSRIGDSVL